jgi:lysophospholipase L1-like esterase
MPLGRELIDRTLFALVRFGHARRLFPSVLTDYGNTMRYAVENVQLTRLTPLLDRVVFMGDSITAGAPFIGGDRYVNRGINGQVTAQMLIRFRPDVVALAPSVVVILGGINDLGGYYGRVSLTTIENNLAAMVDIAHANAIGVVLASLLPVHDGRRDMTAVCPPAAILELNHWIERYAAENDCVFLDYFSATVDPDGALIAGYSDDGLHPNAAGYSVMAPLADRAVREALAKIRGRSGGLDPRASDVPLGPRPLDRREESL